MDCQLPTIKYAEFSKRINRKIQESNLPICGAIEITNKCNMRCTHCYVPREMKSKPKELTTKEIFQIVNQVAEAGCLWLLITGGEPLLRKDFLQIYDDIKGKGILITLFTNGTLITPKIADHLAKKPPFSVEISLYGATKETYEKVTRIPGSYEKCLRGIKLLKAKGLTLKLKTMGLKSNLGEIKAMQKMAKELGLPFRFDPLINPSLDGAVEPLKERLSSSEVIQLEKDDKERSREWRKLYKKYYGYTKSDYVYTCGAGRNYFLVDAYGNLGMCVLLRIPDYSLRKGSFMDGYRMFENIRQIKKTVSDECSKCKINIMCGLCPGWSALEKGDASKKVEYLCQVAHLRAKYFGDFGG